MSKTGIQYIVILSAAAACGLAMYLTLGNPAKQAPVISQPMPLEPEVLTLPAFSAPDLDGKTRTLSEWDGKVRIINFWATWCPPCRAEIPGFMALQESIGSEQIQFIGIAIDDLDKVKKFADELGINYPSLISELEGIQLSKSLGNRFGGLPFTVIAGPDGKILSLHPGELPKNEAEIAIRRALKLSSNSASLTAQ